MEQKQSLPKKNVVSTVKELITDSVVQAGCDLWDVEYIKEGAVWVLRITIDKEGGVSLDDCEKVHRIAEAIIDEADPIETSYNLETSSPGLDRELKYEQHFLKYIDHPVRVKLYAVNKNISSKQFTGRLISYNSEGIVIEVDGEYFKNDENNSLLLARNEIAHIHVVDAL